MRSAPRLVSLIALLALAANLSADEPYGRHQFDDSSRSHWSFKKLERPTVPTPGTQWGRNPIDAFVADGLARAGLSPAAPADRVTLLRRVYLDLIGLPPTPEEVAAFVADTSDTAFERVVDDLLARPQYGERWARHWLDVVAMPRRTATNATGPRPRPGSIAIG